MDSESEGVRARISGLRFHNLRHTALAWMIEAGADIVSVQRIAGHSTIQMTSRYLHPTAENQRLAVERLGNFICERRMSDPEITTPQDIAKSLN